MVRRRAAIGILFLLALASSACSGDYDNEQEPMPDFSPADDDADDDVSDDDLDDDVDDDADDDTADDILPQGDVFFFMSFDVGLGDASLVGIPGGDGMHYVMMDAGLVGEGQFTICPILAAHGIDKLDLMIVSHADYDHCGGVADILQCVDVDLIWENGEPNPDDDGWSAYVPARDAWGGPVELPNAGDTRAIGNATLRVLNTNSGWPDWNNDALVVKVDDADFSVFIGSDAETEAQDAMVTNFASQLDSRVVRIPDHAGPGWSQDFIDLVAASMEIGIISVGDNDIGYPDPDTLAAWEATGRTIYTTQDSGHVLVTADGDDLVVETFATD